MTTRFGFRTVGVLVLTAVAVCLGLLNLSDRIHWKLPADGALWSQDAANGVYVASVASNRTALQSGDRLVAINDIPIRDLNDYHEVMAVVSQPPFSAAPARYAVEREAQELVIPVQVTLESQISSTDYFLIFVAFVYLATGLFIFLRNGNAKAAFHFYLLCLVAFVLFLFRVSGQADLFDIGIYWADAVALLLLGPLFVHFCCYFPTPLAMARRRGFKLALYAPFVLLLVSYAAWFTARLSFLGLPRNQESALLLDRIHLGHFLVYSLVGAGLLVILRRDKTAIERQQLKWLSYGTLAGTVPFVLFYGIPYLFGMPIAVFMNASVLSLALIPVSYGYAITRYRLMDVDVIARRGVAYLLASSALLALYLLIAIVLGGAALRLSPESGFILFSVAALLVAFLFAPLRARIQAQLDRFFYKDGYDYRQSIADFGRTLASEIDLGRLTAKVRDRISRTLDVPEVSLFLRNPVAGGVFQRIDTEPDSAFRPRLEISAPESAFYEASDFEQPLIPAFSSSVEQFRQQLVKLGLHYAEPLRAHGRLLGFLALGRKKDGQLLSSEDLDLVAGLASYVAIAVDNALLYQSLESKARDFEQLKLYSENVIESLVAGVAVLTPEGRITVWNSAMQLMSGVDREKAVGLNVEQALESETVDHLRNVVNGPGWTVDRPHELRKVRLVATGGQERLVNVSVAPFVLEDEVNTGTLLLFEDVTEKSRLEGQLAQAEKLSSIGLFAAGVAHEVNTPLAGISSYAQLLLKDAPEGSPQRELLAKIEKQTFRASGIVNNLLKFARVSDTEFQAINVNSLMLDTLSLLEHQLKKGQVDISLDLDPSLPATLGNGGRLQQVFMNLFLNAKDAMPEGGQLSIRTYKTDAALMIEVHDTGHGISAQDIERIYDPFFTTKAVGKGTGLGLSVSYGIIQEHSGRISVASEAGRGTTFTVELPLKRVN